MSIDRLIGQQVRKLRKARNMTLEQVSVRAGISLTHLGALERSEKEWKVRRLSSVAAALGVTPGAILDLATEEN